MKKTKLLAILIVLFFINSCGPSILTMNYKYDNQNTGSIIIEPSKTTIHTFITINDSLIVNDRNVDYLTVNNLPEGVNTIRYWSDYGYDYKYNLDTKMSFEVVRDSTITVPIEVPPYKGTFYLRSITSSVLLIAIIALLL